MQLREQAIARVRRNNARRWLGTDSRRLRGGRLAAAVFVVAAGLALAIQLSPFGYRPGFYATSLGEQRTVELPDRSRIVMDSRTRLQVSYSNDARIIRLLDGQAQFSVARDPGRPFKVEAGDRLIVALGTVFNVEFVEQEVHVAMLEGQVAVIPQAAGKQASANVELAAVELTAGEEMRGRVGAAAVVRQKGDLEAANAWRQGKVIFRDETLGEAVRRLNRHSRVRIEVSDPGLVATRVSGVFDTGDAQAFVEAMQGYLEVNAEPAGTDTIRLEPRAR